MATNADFHVSISSPDNTVFPSFKLSEFESGNVDPSRINLSVVRAKCKMYVSFVNHSAFFSLMSKFEKVLPNFSSVQTGRLLLARIMILLIIYQLHQKYVSIIPKP